MNFRCLNFSFILIELRVYIAKGAFVNIRDHKKWTPLHCAAMIGNIEIANILIECKADLGPQDANGLTPLDISIEYGHYTGEIR